MTEKVKRSKLFWIEYVLLVLIVVGSFLLRVLPQLNKVFVANLVWFRETDPWYHERLADLVNFPHWDKVDFFAKFPDGASSGYMPMLAWLSFNDHFAAFLPPLFGVLALVCIYLIGKELFSSKVGLTAALVASVIPGEFLHRTLLGFTDHHALEMFFMPLIILLLLKVRKTWSLKWTIPLGIAIGFYLLSWAGAALLLLIIGLWVWWECLVCIKDSKLPTHLIKTVSLACVIGVLMSFPYQGGLTLALTLALAGIPVAIWILVYFLKDPFKILFALTILVPIALAFLGAKVDYYYLLAPIFWGGGSWIQEAMPLGPGSILAIYGLAFILAIPAIWFFRNKNPLFLIWAIVFLVAGIGQRRWGYYLTIPLSLLAAAFTFKIGEWVVPRTKIATVAIVIIFLIVPNGRGTLGVANLPNQMTSDWYVMCTWMKQNTADAEMFEHIYYANDEKVSYGIMSWWDYGHWIIRIAHRVPLTSPTQTATYPSLFYSSSTEEQANAEIKGLNIKYLLIDYEMLTTKWPAICSHAHRDYTTLKVQSTFSWTLWTEQATTWKMIYQRGDIKLFERIAP